MKEQNLLMLLLGCRPPGRNTEQHDIYFGIAEDLKDLIPGIKKSWPETKGNIHIDAWRKVTCVDGYKISVKPITSEDVNERTHQLFFINLGGYKENEFDEFHYKMLVVSTDLEAAKTQAKKSAFFKHSSVSKTPNTPNATAHIDDKFGIDIDDAFRLEDILPDEYKNNYRLTISLNNECKEPDELHLGYFRLVDL